MILFVESCSMLARWTSGAATRAKSYCCQTRIGENCPVSCQSGLLSLMPSGKPTTLPLDPSQGLTPPTLRSYAWSWSQLATAGVIHLRPFDPVHLLLFFTRSFHMQRQACCRRFQRDCQTTAGVERSARSRRRTCAHPGGAARILPASLPLQSN